MAFWTACLILLSTCGFHVLGNTTTGMATRTPQELQVGRGTPGPSRRPLLQQKRMDKGREMCEAGTHLSPNGCRTIQPGCVCVKCPPEKYIAMPNLRTSCKHCSRCDTGRDQIQLQRCTAQRNTQCGCPVGYMKVDSGDEENDFRCRTCVDCLMENRSVREACSEFRDAVCGACLPGFCSVGRRCQPCPSSTRSPPATFRATVLLTTPATSPSTEAPTAEICGRDCKLGFGGLLLFLLLLLLGTLAFRQRKRHARSRSATAPGVHTVSANFSLPQYSSEDTVGHAFVCSAHHRLLCAGPPAPHVGSVPGVGQKPPLGSSLLHGRNMYTVIDAVPVRRWKEFVRGLGLRDGEIELVELEHAQFREQQYEMLKRWSHQQGASLGTVLAVLESMQLGGCAQALREQLLQPGGL